MGSGSDHMAFLQRAGIPCVDQKVGRPKVSILVSCFIDFIFCCKSVETS